MSTTKFNEIFVLFSFHQWVDAWHKFSNSASKVIGLILRYTRNSRLQDDLFI